MLYARSERPPREAPSRPAARTRGVGLTDFLLDVLESAESYDAQILQAEREEDAELAAFLRELRRQDVVRTREVTRLLRRPYEETWGDPEKEIGAC
ncbi:MAG TPA: hypothetical protein VGR18_11760 [Rubrobacter sp.]|nr:hypothetical protein [Rubrobacter sp.]